MTVRSLIVSGRKGVIFTLSGQLGLAGDVGAPYDTTNAIKIDTDGSIYEGDEVDGGGLVYTQVDTVTDWLRPVTNPTSYFFRYSNVVGTFTSTPGSVDTAIAVSSDLVWTLNSTSQETISVTFDLEILDTDQTSVLAGPSAYRVRCFNQA